MALANLRVLKDMKVRALTAVNAHRAKFYDPNTWPIAVCNGSYLDVDGILARSLPEVVSVQVAPVSGRFSRRGFKALATIAETTIQGIR